MQRTFLHRFLAISMLFFAIVLPAHATETQPKFLLTPTSTTTVNLPANGAVTLQYRVTNKTDITRTLTMKPVQGVTVVTSGSGVCANPFTLSHNDSCLLTLTIDGSQVSSSGIHGGPVVCKTQSASNARPDPFLCSQPPKDDILNINIASAETPTITVTPDHLGLQVSGPAQNMTVTNTSSTVTVTNVTGILTGTALNGLVTQNASACASIKPGQSCNISFTPGNTSVTTTPFSIHGDNTSTVTASIKIATLSISVTPTHLTLQTDGSSGVMTVTNNSNTTAALNVSAILGNALQGNVTVTYSGCASIAALGSCTITFAPGSASVPQTTVYIDGDNTISVATSVTITAVTRAYVANFDTGVVSVCVVDTTNGTFSSCATAGDGFINPTGIALNSTGTTAYILAGTSYAIMCQINLTDGTFRLPCTFASASFFAPNHIALNTANTMAYVTNLSGDATSACPIQNDGKFSTCLITTGFFEPAGVALGYIPNTPSTALGYVVNFQGTVVSLCNIANTGQLFNCNVTGPVFNAPVGIALNNAKTYAYIVNSGSNSVDVCAITANSGALNNVCTSTGSGLSGPSSIALNSSNTYAYISNYNNGAGTTVSVCLIDPTNGTFSSCAPISGFNGPAGIALVEL